jgi:DNA-directed RNA polymerase specialized sigma24 family protein
MRVNFEGVLWDVFAQRVAEYGLTVIRAWICTGKIFQKCADVGYPLASRPSAWRDEDLATLANDTVAQALVELRQKGLRGGDWQPSRGASLKTYFITGCIYTFPNIYRRWWRQQVNWGSSELVDPAEMSELNIAGAKDVAREVAERVDVARECAAMSDKQRAALLLNSYGFTHAEIAEVLGVQSARAVEGILYRAREIFRKRSSTVDRRPR